MFRSPRLWIALHPLLLLLPSCGPSGGPFTYYPNVWATPLHQAAEASGPGTVRQQIKAVGDVDPRDEGGRTPLMLAAHSSQPVNDNLRALLEAGADANAQDNNGLTPLMYAAMSPWHFEHGGVRTAADTVERLRILISAGADVNARDNSGRTPLMCAAGANRFAVLPDGASCTTLLELGAHLEDRDNQGRTALMHAARAGGSNVAAFLRAGADINATDDRGRTPLMLAFDDDWHAGDSVKALLAGHPNLEPTDHDGWTALAHAVQKARTKHPVVEILDAGAKLEPLRWTPLHAAAVSRDPGKVRTLIASGVDVNARDRWGRTPLMWAVRFIDDDMQTAAALIAGGAAVDAADDEGLTALHIAASHAWNGEVQSLLNARANIEARDKQGRTPLMLAAAARSHMYQAEYLIKAGAYIDAQDGAGRTALVHAVLNPAARGDAVPILLSAHANKGFRDNAGRTALDYAQAGLADRMPAEKREIVESLRP